MHWFGIGFMIGMGLLIPVLLMIAAFWFGGYISELIMQRLKEDGAFDNLMGPDKKEKPSRKKEAQKIKMGFM